ncbi:MAG: protein pufQ [Aestuariivita sp.]|jgi:hypothetical protein|nr:protein pufQ [Aestuariivita sp.]
MTDIASNTNKPRVHRRRSVEFTVYFSIIFVLAIPFAAVFWVLEVIRKQTLKLRGPLARAWAEADRVTPLIFSA